MGPVAVSPENQLNPFASRRIALISIFWICATLLCFTKSTATYLLRFRSLLGGLVQAGGALWVCV